MGKPAICGYSLQNSQAFDPSVIQSKWIWTCTCRNYHMYVTSSTYLWCVCVCENALPPPTPLLSVKLTPDFCETYSKICSQVRDVIKFYRSIYTKVSVGKIVPYPYKSQPLPLATPASGHGFSCEDSLNKCCRRFPVVELWVGFCGWMSYIFLNVKVHSYILQLFVQLGLVVKVLV